MDTLSDYSEVLAPLIPLGEMGAKAMQKLTESKDIVSLKEDVGKELSKLDRRILIIIDEIDRLASDEIRQLFRLIKAVADFPNITYLVAFDREIVTKALASEQANTGESYLEKIIQVPFELPLPEPSELHRLFQEQAQQIFTGYDETIFDDVYWGNIFYDGIAPFLTSPRAVNRLVNTFRVTYPAVRGEVNLADFVAIETLRVFCPLAYSTIRSNKSEFTTIETDGKAQKEFHDTWLSSLPERDRTTVKTVLMRIFPQLESIWANKSYASGFYIEWRKLLRVCISETFPIYFRLQMPAGYVTREEMKTAISVSNNAVRFEHLLLSYAKKPHPAGGTLIGTFLSRLDDYIEDIPVENVQPILTSFFKVSDEILKLDKGKTGFGFFGNDFVIARVIHRLVRRFNTQTERFEAYKASIQTGTAIGIIVWEVGMLGQEQGKDTDELPKPENTWIVNAEQLAELEKLALIKIKSITPSALLESPRLLTVLHWWLSQESETEVKHWVVNATIEDSNLALFIEHFIQEKHSVGWSFDGVPADRVSRKTERVEPSHVERYLTLTDEIKSRLFSLQERRDTSDKQRKAVKMLCEAIAKSPSNEMRDDS